MKVLFLGDGMTKGLPGIIHYPELVARNPHMEVINEGISGATIKDVYLHATEVIPKYNPDVVCILVGLNDLILGRTFREVFAQYLYLINLLRKQGIRNILVSNLPWISPNVVNPTLKNTIPKIQEFNNLINAFCNINNVNLIDNHANLQSENYYQNGFIYLNQQGEQILAINFYRALKKLNVD